MFATIHMRRYSCFCHCNSVNQSHYTDLRLFFRQKNYSQSSPYPWDKSHWFYFVYTLIRTSFWHSFKLYQIQSCFNPYHVNIFLDVQRQIMQQKVKFDHFWDGWSCHNTDDYVKVHDNVVDIFHPSFHTTNNHIW